MSKRFWAIIAVIILIFVGVVVMKNNKANAPGGSVKATNHVEGAASTGVKLVEYGDYECPYCEQYYPIVKQVVAKYGGQISFQFRNLPLTSIHPNALAAARAAEAASLQGKFWQMHDLLYANQNAWVSSSNPLSVFNQFATALGLNKTQFDTDFASSKVNDSIQADIAAFNNTGDEQSTPAFYLNGKKIEPNNTVADFSKFIDVQITASKTKK